MSDKLITVIIGALVAILGATGVLTADEGTQATGYAVSISTGVLGLVELIRGVIKRRNGDGAGKD